MLIILVNLLRHILPRYSLFYLILTLQIKINDNFLFQRLIHKEKYNLSQEPL